MSEEKKKDLSVLMDPRTRPVQMTLEQAAARISNEVYNATALVEQLEGAGLIRGNGHHIRQKMAAMCEELFRERWNGPSDLDKN